MSCNLQESSFYVLSGCSAGVARFVRDEEVVGSNPATPTINYPGLLTSMVSSAVTATRLYLIPSLSIQ